MSRAQAGAGFMLLFGEQPIGYRIFFSFVIITLPTMIFRKIAFYLFATPCLIHDESATTAEFTECADCAKCCCSCLGYSYCVLWSVAFLIVGAVLWASSSSISGLISWALGIAQFWGLWFIIVLATAFNPSPTFSRFMCPLNCLAAVLTCGLVPNPIGRWHAERAQVHLIFRDTIQERGAEEFFLVPSAVALDSKKIFLDEV
jgi:hypothetical protein